MALQIDIPMSFEFRPHPTPWVRRVATVLGSTKERFAAKFPNAVSYFGSEIDVDAEITTEYFAPTNETGGSSETFVATLTFVDMPGRAQKPEYLRRALAGKVDIFTTERGQIQPGKEADAWQMRDEFFGLKTREAVLTFLSRWGMWTWAPLNRLRLPGQPPRQIVSSRVFSEHYASPEKILEFQDFYRSALRGPADKWLTYATGMFAAMENKVPDSIQEEPGWRTQLRTNYPHLLVCELFCQGAIEATITFDHLRRIKTRICKRHDCTKPFTVKTRHKRAYCSQYCGHLESVRRQSRANSKAKKNSRKQG